MNCQNIERQIRTERELSIEKKQLGIKDIMILCSCLTKNIIKLNLGSNLLDYSCMQRLSQAQWSRLTILKLDGNKVGNKGCKYLTKAQLKQIREISIGHNEIETGGVSHLSKSTWKTLRKIDLQCNKIGSSGSKFLIKGNWKELYSVCLSCNRLTNKEMLMIVFLRSKCIQHLCLWENIYDEDYQMKLEQYIMRKFGHIKLQL